MNDVTAIRGFEENEKQVRDDISVPELVSAQGSFTPDALALKDETQRLTYRELNERANGLAATLRACGVGPDVVVGLVMPRSPAMVVAALGILKAGGGGHLSAVLKLSHPRLG